MHLNYGKLKRHRDNMEESLEDIREILVELSKEDFTGKETFLMKVSIDSFRISLVRLREELFGAVGSILKSSNIRVSDFSSNKDFVKKCIDLGYFREIPEEFIRDLNRYRNEAAYRYKVPKFFGTHEFYINNEKYFRQIIEDITAILDKQYKNSKNVKNLDIF